MIIVYTGKKSKIQMPNVGTFVRDVPRPIDKKVGKKLIKLEDFQEYKPKKKKENKPPDNIEINNKEK